MKRIDQIITQCDTRRGAPMGRSNTIYPSEHKIICCGQNKVVLVDLDSCTHQRLFDCAVPMSDGYDSKGAYWGLGPQLRVTYNADLSYVNFYRLCDDGDFRKQEIEEPTKFVIRYNKEYNAVEAFTTSDGVQNGLVVVSKSEGHSMAVYEYYYKDTKPANEEQIKECYRFLVGIGYFPITVKKLKF